MKFNLCVSDRNDNAFQEMCDYLRTYLPNIES